VRQRPRFVPGLRPTVLDALLPPFVEAAPAALFKGLLARAVDVGAGHVGEFCQSGIEKPS
jgi:hypothetical protein